MPITSSLQINRDQLAKFLPDHETIRQFENLFAVADEVNTNPIIDVAVDAGKALAKANLALSSVNWKRKSGIITPLVITDGLDINGSSTFNKAFGLKNFTINKNGSGIAYSFNGTTEAHILDGASVTLTAPIDFALLNAQPTGGTALAISTTKYVDDNTFWIRTGTTLSPETAGDSLSIDAAAIFNTDSGSNDFTINGSGTVPFFFDASLNKTTQTGDWATDTFKYLLADTGGLQNLHLGVTQNTANTANNNVFGGYRSGKSNTTGTLNVFLGTFSGQLNTNGSSNLYVGYQAGQNSISGARNLYMGSASGRFSTGSDNCFMGSGSGGALTSGNSNLFLGTNAGNASLVASFNTYIGVNAGALSTGATNVFIGFNSGKNETGSNLLYISNSDTATPLIWGDFSAEELTINGSFEAIDEMTHGTQIWISDPSQLPTAVSNVITLLADTTYYFTADIDLSGDRLVGGANTCLLGASSENASITSTGLTVGVALFTSDYTTPMRHISFHDVDTCIDIDGSRSGTTVALDWTGVNFDTIPNIGTIKDVDNWIYSKSALIASQGLIFDGTIGTIGADNSIFTGDGTAGSIIEIASTCIITRRFRIVYSSIVATSSTVGIDANVSATIPSEGYILDTVNFSGGGTYTTGVAYTDDKARFVGVRGVSNSAEIGAYYMIGNATATTISTISTPVKIAGTTTLNTVSQKFTHANNKITYDGALTRIFKISVTTSFTGGNNKDISVFIAKNGTVDPTSEMLSTTDGSGRAESITTQTIIEMSETDYIEVWIENNSDTSNVTVEYLNAIALGVTS